MCSEFIFCNSVFAGFIHFFPLSKYLQGFFYSLHNTKEFKATIKKQLVHMLD